MKFYLLNFIYAFILILLIEFGLNPLWDFLIETYNIESLPYTDDESSIVFIFSILVFAPIIETLIFQVLVWFLLENTPLKTYKRKYYLYVIISGILFGLTHIYSVVHVFKASLAGFVFMAFFIKIRKIKHENNAILFIMFIHFFLNLFVWVYRNSF